MSVEWRPDAPHNLVKLVVGRCLIAQMDYGRWIELGLLTDTSDVITRHPRLLRSLGWGDDDYDGCVHSMTPTILGEQPEPSFPPYPTPPGPALRTRFPHLDTVSDFLDLPAWLSTEDPAMFDRLIAAAEDSDATMPDGMVLSAAEAAAARLEVSEMRRQVDRIRRDHAEDPEAAVGQAKELIETVCKTILGMTGDGSDTKEDLPKLVTRTMLHVGLDPANVSGENAVEVRAAKRLLGGVTSVLNGAGELRNARGTGHGRSGTPVVDPALARLAVGVVLPAVLYLIEIYEAQTEHAAPPPLVTDNSPAPNASSGPASGVTEAGTSNSSHFVPPFASVRGPQTVPPLEVGAIVEYATFGEGQVVDLAGAGTKLVASIDFGGEVGVRRLLVAYAGLRVRT
jgi:hypothetical protein